MKNKIIRPDARIISNLSYASRLALLFTLAALVIAVIGIAGLATFNTMRKHKEIGIRYLAAGHESCFGQSNANLAE